MTKRNPLSLAATIAAIAVLSACVSARSQERRDPAEIFASADANGDGVVTRAEFLETRASAFSKYDRNGDGFIDGNDIPQRLRARGKASGRLDNLVERFDTNEDRRISRAEFVDGPTLLFDRADANHDGQVSKDEISALRARAR